MSAPQPGILADLPPIARYLFFRLLPNTDPGSVLSGLGDRLTDAGTVIGLGASLVRALGSSIDGLRVFPAHAGPGVDVPSTSCALWCWLRGDDRGVLLHEGRALEEALADAFELEEVIDAFRYGTGLDLSGYEDGTENPTGDDGRQVALVAGRGPGLDGSSFVAVQRWVHDLDRMAVMSQDERDLVIGRRLSDNEEIDDAPPAAHVKRTAQESFEPEAFVVRRSMPWADGDGEGLVFVAFGRSLDAFEVMLARMVGAEDGVTDALFRFSRPVSGAHFWCPPVRDRKLDLSALWIRPVG